MNALTGVPAAASPVTSRSSVRTRAELDEMRERLACAQRAFEDYTAAREARRREAERAWERLSREASFVAAELRPGLGEHGAERLPVDTPELPPAPQPSPQRPAGVCGGGMRCLVVTVVFFAVVALLVSVRLAN